MTEIDKTIQAAIQNLHRHEPRSIFVYGSRGRGDGRPDSDYELGVVFDDSKYVHRHDVQTAVSRLGSVRAYPFRLSELQAGTFDSPFVKTLFLRELTLTARTVLGERVVEALIPPPITTLDLIQCVRFELGYALAAVLSDRSGDTATAADEFSKSCFYGVRCLEIHTLQTFPADYHQIHQLAPKVTSDPEHLAIINAAYALRRSADQAVDSVTIFENISLLNFVENTIVQSFHQQGNQTVV